MTMINLAEFYHEAGKKLELRGMHSEAIEKYHSAINQGYGNSNLYFDLGRCYLALGYEEKANRCFSQI